MNVIKIGLETAVFLTITLFLAACAPAPGTGPAAVVAGGADAATTIATARPPVNLPDLGPAPEITNDVWVNSDAPVTLASVRGKVVLLEFWTFGCINCQHVIPSIRKWYEKYNGDDFTVISVHYPEFRYEREYDNVVAAVQRLDVPYPVAIDNDRVTWGAYRQRYWPTTYLIDKNGRIRYKHIGEGAYEETEAAILALISE